MHHENTVQKKCNRSIYNYSVYSNLIHCISILGFCRKTALQQLLITEKKIVPGMAGVSSYKQFCKIFNKFSLLALDKIHIYMTYFLLTYVYMPWKMQIA